MLIPQGRTELLRLIRAVAPCLLLLLASCGLSSFTRTIGDEIYVCRMATYTGVCLVHFLTPQEKEVKRQGNLRVRHAIDKLRDDYVSDSPRYPPDGYYYQGAQPPPPREPVVRGKKPQPRTWQEEWLYICANLMYCTPEQWRYIYSINK